MVTLQNATSKFFVIKIHDKNSLQAIYFFNNQNRRCLTTKQSYKILFMLVYNLFPHQRLKQFVFQSETALFQTKHYHEFACRLNNKITMHEASVQKLLYALIDC